MFTEDEKIRDWPHKLYMLHENEMWLGELAKTGLILKSFSKSYAYFDEEESQKHTYKFVILDEKQTPKNQIRIIEHQGFKYVGGFKEYHIFSIEAKYDHTEPRLNAEAIKYAERWFNLQTISRFGYSIIALLPAAVSMFLNIDGFFIWLVDVPQFYLIIYILLLAFIFISALDEYNIILKSKRCFLKQEKYIMKTNKIKDKIMGKAIFLVLALLAVAFIFNTYIDKSSRHIPIAEVAETIPVLLIQDVTQNEEFTIELEELQKRTSDESYATVGSSFLAPKQYNASQNYDGHYLSAEYYEVFVENVAKKITFELIENKPWKTDKEKIREVDIAGLDKAYIYVGGGSIHVSAGKGKKVMYIWYTGDKTGEELLVEISKVM